MSKIGQLKLSDVRKMLKKCARGFLWEVKPHAVHVGCGGLWYRNLPTGHGSGDEINPSHVRQLARALGIETCANGFFPGLGA